MPTVVFVVAHADDLELGAGGTCARLVAKGYDARVVVVADDADPALTPIRRQEAIAGAKALGVAADNVHFLGLGMGHVTCNHETVTALRGVVAHLGVAPLAVFTHSLADSHQDHVEVSRLARAAFRETALFTFMIRNSAIPSAFAPSVYCIVDDHLTAKETALRAHASQAQAGRVPIDKVRAFTERFAQGRGGQYCEAFELAIQNGAADVGQLIAAIDSSQFTQFWSPMLAEGRLAVLVGNAPDERDPDHMSDLLFLTRLQSRLAATVQARLGETANARFVVHHARGPGDVRHLERNHVLVLGGAPSNPAAEVMPGWLGLPPSMASSSDARRRAREGCGLLTIAANPLAARHGLRRYLIGAGGHDQASSLAAAMCLLDDAKIAGILPEARAVHDGRLAMVEIEVACDWPVRRKPRARTRQGGQLRASA